VFERQDDGGRTTKENMMFKALVVEKNEEGKTSAAV